MNEILSTWGSIIALFLNFFGTVLFAASLFCKIKGNKLDFSSMLSAQIHGGYHNPTTDEIETPEYKRKQKSINRAMEMGIFFYSLGFIIQLIISWPK